MSPIPEGFRPARIPGEFVALNGPLYGKWADGKLVLAFRVEQRHLNALKICHGGMLATFADMLVPCEAMYREDFEHRFMPTVSLQIDYMGPAPMGAWVQGEAQILRKTRNLLFGQALVTADGAPALRVSGVFKLGSVRFGDADDRDPLGLK